MTWELRDALVGNRQGLYQKNGTFNASITILAQLLPLMVDGIAADAERNEVSIAERIGIAERLFPGGNWGEFNEWLAKQEFQK